MLRKATPITSDLQATAARLHRESIVIDGMCLDHIVDPHSTHRFNEPYVRRYRSGGLTAFNHASISNNFREGIKHVRRWQDRIRHNPDVAISVTRAEDIRRAKAEGKLGIIVGFQTAAVMEDDTDFLEPLYAVGVRVMQVTYNERGLLGDGCQETNATGLSDLGVAAVREMNRLGMVVDVSHAADATAYQAAEASEDPIIISHTACAALRPNPRSAGDDVIRAVAQKGGVVGICFLPFLLNAQGRTTATMEDLMRHVDHVADLAGVDHVGFGSDLTEEIVPTEMITDTGALGVRPNKPYKPSVYPPLPWIFPPEMDSVAKFGNLTLHLLARGYSDEEARKIIGGNFLRVFLQVWR